MVEKRHSLAAVSNSNAEISLHYDGPIAMGHVLPLRVVGGAFNNLQSAIDRAVLDVKYGTVWKHARLKRLDYPLAGFEITGFREGGFIADLRQSAGSYGPQIVDRIRSALVPGHAAAVSSAHETYNSLADQAGLRLSTLQTTAISATPFSAFIESSNSEITGKYGDRSILKEFDQLLSPIRAKANNGSTLEITLSTDKTTTVSFNVETAKNFHRIVSTRRVGNPLIVEVLVRSLDQGNNFLSAKGKLKNMLTKRDFTLHIGDESAFNSLLPYLVKGKRQQKVNIIACPILEYESFDPYGGDMFFLGLA